MNCHSTEPKLGSVVKAGLFGAVETGELLVRNVWGPLISLFHLLATPSWCLLLLSGCGVQRLFYFAVWVSATKTRM